jgi:hypothetical protein
MTLSTSDTSSAPPVRPTTSRWRGPCTILGVIATLASCNAVLGIREYDSPVGNIASEAGLPNRDGGADAEVSSACGLIAGSSSCAACIQSECCGQASACATNSACTRYESCLLPCGADYACRSRCLIADLASAAEIPPVDECVSAQCGAQCGLACGSTTTYAEPDAATACIQCLVNNDCSAAQTCGSSLECQKAAQCGLECTSEDCAHACLEGNEAGVDDFSSFAFGLTKCLAPCGLGNFWECATAPPLITSFEQTTITLNFVALPSGRTVAGALVKACDVTDVTCANPVVPAGVTDDAGNVTFTLPKIGPFGFWGYFDISSGSLYPSLYFLRSPLSVPTVTFPEVFLPEPSRVQDMYSALGVPPDATRGVIEIQAVDCHFTPAPNVTARAAFADAGAGLAYFSNGSPTLDPTASATDGTGFAVLVNAPTGSPTTITLTPPSGRPTSTVKLFARPATWSTMLVRP